MTTRSPLILSIVGARPQFVKIAPFCRAAAVSSLNHEVIHTGQHYHYDMSEGFFEELGIKKPLVNLGVGSGSHGLQTGRMLEKLEKLFGELQPNYIIVYGDTNSTIAASLAASKMMIPIAHAEAGQRSYRRDMPEEINRVVTDVLASLLFTTGELASATLVREGRTKEEIVMVGDLMYDAFLLFRGQTSPSEQLSDLLEIKEDFILATFHRAENTDDPIKLQIIVNALTEIALSSRIIIPLHPRTKKMLDKYKISFANCPNLIIIDPVGYRDILELLAHCSLVITDSGGLQKEAYFAEKRSLILRKETEWAELAQSGWVRLMPEDSSECIVDLIRKLQNEDSSLLARDPSWFGNGDSAAKMIHTLESKLVS
ncbi:MAG: UDP-N-acetylglucosamine 2-epimerase (non-hydrolyzing) [Bdellovibrionales bacterium]|nr:UDP-N-acetylglucosamine 2-epimerase (non-hydrolyzing) [Bdellovibrionales bacterium]